MHTGLERLARLERFVDTVAVSRRGDTAIIDTACTLRAERPDIDPRFERVRSTLEMNAIGMSPSMASRLTRDILAALDA